ncbi:MAG: GNAT family N-acetyltransferase [Halodesulfurarchaeum sp.]
MEFLQRGDETGGPPVELDWREFPYAGKFVMTDTGKALLREDGVILAGAAFSVDRTDSDRVWIRYLTVRYDRQGEQLGPKLANSLAGDLLERDFERVMIAVNNPTAFRALYRAGFAFTGRETGLAELVLERPARDSTTTYLVGLRQFADRELPAGRRKRLEAWIEAGSPPASLSDTD